LSSLTKRIFVKVIDVDLDRRRISLSLKQANDSVDPSSEDFDPALYGMPAEYDEERQLQVPRRLRSRPPTSGSPGTRSSARNGRAQYAASAHDLWEEHKAFAAKESRERCEPQQPKTVRNPLHEEKKAEETSTYSSDAGNPKELSQARRSACRTA
jgi:small subunit ribosomal protein S1